MNMKISYRRIPATPLRPGTPGRRGRGMRGLMMVSQAIGRSQLEISRLSMQRGNPEGITRRSGRRASVPKRLSSS